MKLRRLDILVLALVAAVATMYGGRKGAITYPRTDPSVAYIADAGSYLTNDFVHVNFTRVIVPDTASLYIDRREVAATNDPNAWINHITTTFAQFAVPQDISFQNATNYDWMVYTDWTPGPSVVTNGVWHAFWGVDQRQGKYFIPIRTAVRENGNTIATPKSRKDAQ